MNAIFHRVFFVFVCLYLLTGLELKAQLRFKNEFHSETSFTILPINEKRTQSLFGQFGITYGRTFKKFSASASYSFWNSTFLLNTFEGALTSIFEIDTSQWVGTINGRFKYQFANLTVSYWFFPIRNVLISFGVGPSCTWGTNSYITGYFYSSGIPDWVLWHAEKKELKWGGSVEVQGKYFFFNQRLNAGIVCKKRIYPNYYRQFEGGIQIGVNF